MSIRAFNDPLPGVGLERGENAARKDQLQDSLHKGHPSNWHWRNSVTHIVVTGGSGKAGRAVVRALTDAGYDVLNVDLAPSSDPIAPFLRTDLTDFGQTVDSLKTADAVVHLAAISAPRLAPDEVTFRTNVASTYNVFHASATLRLRRVVWASSETLLGLPFDRVKPEYAPINEAATRYPETAYALSKLAAEEIAGQYARWTGTPHIGLRFSNVIVPDEPITGPGGGVHRGYDAFTTWQDDAHARKWNLWGYVDARDCGLACLRALEADVAGAENFIIAADDTVMNRDSRDLMAEVFPRVPVRELPHPRATLLSIEKARRLLGYEPEHSWRDEIA